MKYSSWSLVAVVAVGISNMLAAPTEVILDNISPGVVFTGPWVTTTGSGTGVYGTNYRHDNLTNKGLCSVEYRPTLEASTYAVYAWWTGNGTGNDANTGFLIDHAEGRTEVRISQQVGSQWIFLGAYSFNAGTSGGVTITNELTLDRVLADAVKFTPVTLPAVNRNTIPVQPVADAFDALRNKRIEMLVGPEDYDLSDPDIFYRKLLTTYLRANAWWMTMDKSPTRTLLWSDLSNTTVDRTYTAITRLRDMAVAYTYSPTKNGLELYQNAALRDDIVSALAWIMENRYYTSMPYNNSLWVTYRLTIPRELGDIICMLYPYVPAATRDGLMATCDYFNPDTGPSSVERHKPSGNLAWSCRAKALQGIVTKNASKLAVAQLNIPRNFIPSVRSDGDLNGLFTDGSFVDHDYFSYNTGYGQDFTLETADVLELLDNTPWAVTDPARHNLYDYALLGYEPLMFNGDTLPLTLGRATSIPGAQNHLVAYQTARTYASLLQTAPSDLAPTFKSLIKRWVTLSGYNGFFQSNGPVRPFKIIREILDDPSVTVAPQTVGTFIYHNMDRVVHRRPTWAFGLSMSSSRIGRWECIYGRNRKGWYTGDGSTFVQDADYTRYNDNFWPTSDAYRLAGTTVDTVVRELGTEGPAQGDNRTGQSWVGGTYTPDGMFGSAGMQLKGEVSTLTGLKSWFMFDQEVVCLGTAINSTDSRPIETIIDSQKLNSSGNNTLQVNGVTQPSTLGWNATLSSVSTLHLTGNNGSKMGYYFPTPTSVQAIREARSGRWSDLDKKSSGALITRNYLTTWINHGPNPVNGTYAYVLVPDTTQAQLATYAAAQPINILENSADAQAVRKESIKTTAVNFWKDQLKTVGTVTSNRKSAVIVTETADSYDVAVSDPTQLNNRNITVEIAANAVNVQEADPEVLVRSTSPIRFTVNTLRSDGRTYHVRFNKTDDGRGAFASGNFFYKENFNELWLGTSTSSRPWTNGVTLEGVHGHIGTSSTLLPGTVPSVYLLAGSSAGALVSFGNLNSVNRSFGAFSYTNTVAYGVRLVNDTATTKSTFQVSLTLKQWKDTLTLSNCKDVAFSFSTNATALTNGAWVSFSGLDLVAPKKGLSSANLDGELPENQRAVTATLNVPAGVPPGGVLWLRWITPKAQSLSISIDDLIVQSL